MKKYEYAMCMPKRLPQSKQVAAAKTAAEQNPMNLPPQRGMDRLGIAPTRQRIAVITTKYWGAAGIKLTVGFMDGPSTTLRKKILEHMNAWSKTANIKFTFTNTDPQVRITRLPGDGHWSYVGTDVLHIPKNEATMNLDDFSMSTPDSEFFRVVRHETGHTIGCPHEHMRRAMVNRIDKQKAIDFYGATQGWTPDEVLRQVLTPIEEAALMTTPKADETSIMCYQIPGTLTTDGKPIMGGKNINKTDASFIGKIYPKPKKL